MSTLFQAPILAPILAHNGTAPAPVEAFGDFAIPSIPWLAGAPIEALFAGALVLLAMTALFKHSAWIHRFNLLGCIATAAASAGLAISQWSEASNPKTLTFEKFEGAIKADGAALFFTILICVCVVASALVFYDYLKRENALGVEYFALALLAAGGAAVMAYSNDLIVLFVGLEILSLALYVLAGSNLARFESQEGALKYFVLGGLSSACLLYGSALVYGAVGSTNLTTVRTFLLEGSTSGGITFASDSGLGNILFPVGAILILVGLAFKVAAFPFHSWMPDVYQGSPSPVTGFMAAVGKTAAFAALLRVFLSAFQGESTLWRPVIFVLAMATMAIGALMAMMQDNIKRFFGFSSISHAGFILIGLQASTAHGRASVLFYLATYAITTLGTFAIVTVLGGRGDGEHSLKTYKGLAKRSPALALMFTILLFAQAGIPLTSGFIAKFGVIRAAVEVHSYALAIVAMFVTVIGAFGYLRIVSAMYFAEDSEIDATLPAIGIPHMTKIVVAIAVFATIFLGIAPQALVNFAESAVLR